MKNIRDKSNKNVKNISRWTNTNSICNNKKNKIHFFLLTIAQIIRIMIKKKILKKMKEGVENDKELINDEKCWGNL